MSLPIRVENPKGINFPPSKFSILGTCKNGPNEGRQYWFEYIEGKRVFLSWATVSKKFLSSVEDVESESGEE